MVKMYQIEILKDSCYEKSNTNISSAIVRFKYIVV